MTEQSWTVAAALGLLVLAGVVVPFAMTRQPSAATPVLRRRLPNALYLGTLGIVGAVVVLRGWADGRLSAYGLLVVGLLALKLVGSLGPVSHRHHEVTEPRDPDALRVVGVVPFFNEDPQLLLGCLRSLVAQTRALDRLFVIDDGSTDTSARTAVVTALAELGSVQDVEFVVQPRNVGKREALAVAFRAEPDADVYVTVDSDTRVEPEAVGRLLKRFSDPKVTAATGLVLALNHSTNLLTRLIDLRYVNAFLYERAAYSAFGSVLCLCGSLAAYRADVVHDNLDDFLGQRFLGQPAVFGDDRRMTNYALMAGRVVLADDAVAHTAVPERLGHYVRQQVRWNKSFFRESLWVVLTFPLRSAPFWLTFAELASWMLFTSMLLLVLASVPFAPAGPIVVTFVAWVAVMSWVRSMRFLEIERADVSRGAVITRYLLSPAYGVLTLLLLLPLRLWSLLTLRSSAWGTRDDVEVAAGPGVHDGSDPTSTSSTSTSSTSTSSTSTTAAGLVAAAAGRADAGASTTQGGTL